MVSGLPRPDIVNAGDFGHKCGAAVLDKGYRLSSVFWSRAPAAKGFL